MQVFKVPRWVLDNASYPAGHRLEPLVKFAKPGSTTALARVHVPGLKDGLSNLASARHELVLKDKTLDFQNWEYRFWCPENDGDMVCGATCRQCGSCFAGNTVTRRNHNKANGCYDRLVKSYELLLEDGNCVMCDASTRNNKFGVPLCPKGSCVDEWMHETATPKSLESALKIVMRREKEAKEAWEKQKLVNATRIN